MNNYNDKWVISVKRVHADNILSIRIVTITVLEDKVGKLASQMWSA